jgi:hypothetical protein
MKLEDQVAIHQQREETARKNHFGSIAMGTLAFSILAIVYFGTRDDVEANEARLAAINMGCKYISNHVSHGQKVVVADCSGAIVHKAYE